MSEVKRYWVPNGTLADQSGWHQDDTCVVQDWAYDAALAREAALQARLTIADQRVDDLQTQLNADIQLFRLIDATPLDSWYAQELNVKVSRRARADLFGHSTESTDHEQ